MRRRGPGLEQYVTASLVQLLCRMTKLCWFDDDRFRGIVDDSKRLLEKGSQVLCCAVLCCAASAVSRMRWQRPGWGT